MKPFGETLRDLEKKIALQAYGHLEDCLREAICRHEGGYCVLTEEDISKHGMKYTFDIDPDLIIYTWKGRECLKVITRWPKWEFTIML